VKKLLVFAAASEAATGLFSLVYPSIVVRVLFGVEISGAGIVMSRIAGISLTALGLACLAKDDISNSGNGALRGMLTYSLLAALYLVYIGIGREWIGKLLRPAVAVHAVVTILLARAWCNERKVFANESSAQKLPVVS
jgi:hypothetical protein